ncbi:MAG: dethiobiotin synthase [Methylomonas lenta]|nr:dethiobiotin synthase [Methylomonas lenta]
MASGFFITGTDTNVGKTWATIALMHALQRQGQKVVGMKPVAAGCEWHQGGWKNQDAMWLQQYASIALDYNQINPYAFEQAVSPHIACGEIVVNLAVIQKQFQKLQTLSDCTLVEGAGGWLSPLGHALDNAELATALQLPVILVVGMRLGCINHARLSYQAISQAKLDCAGWLAVQLEADMPAFAANLSYIQDSIQAPLLGVLTYLQEPDFGFLAGQVKI